MWSQEDKVFRRWSLRGDEAAACSWIARSRGRQRSMAPGHPRGRRGPPAMTTLQRVLRGGRLTRPPAGKKLTRDKGAGRSKEAPVTCWGPGAEAVSGGQSWSPEVSSRAPWDHSPWGRQGHSLVLLPVCNTDGLGNRNGVKWRSNWWCRGKCSKGPGTQQHRLRLSTAGALKVHFRTVFFSSKGNKSLLYFKTVTSLYWSTG